MQESTLCYDILSISRGTFLYGEAKLSTHSIFCDNISIVLNNLTASAEKGTDLSWQSRM